MGEVEKNNSGMFVKPNIFHSILIFVQNIWGVEIYFWIAYKAQHFQFYPDICVKYLGVETCFWEMCTTQHFSFYPDIYAKHLGGWIPIQKYSSCVTFNEGGTTSPGPIFFWKNWILHRRTGPHDSETAGGIAKEVCFYFWRLFFQWNWATGRKSRGWSNVAKMTFGSNLVCVNMFPIKKN